MIDFQRIIEKDHFSASKCKDELVSAQLLNGGWLIVYTSTTTEDGNFTKAGSVETRVCFINAAGNSKFSMLA